MNRLTKIALMFMGSATAGSSIYAYVNDKEGFYTLIGVIIGLSLIVLPLTKKTD
ncbi:MAG: hypothetical protein AAF731_17975 [Bacteroidota bacterium]